MRRAALAVGLGLAFGVLSVVLNHAGPRPVSALVGSGAGWACFGVVVGAAARGRVPHAALASTLALLAGVLAYYVADSVPADGPLRLVDRGEWALWSVAALVLGPVLGGLGCVLRGTLVRERRGADPTAAGSIGT